MNNLVPSSKSRSSMEATAPQVVTYLPSGTARSCRIRFLPDKRTLIHKNLVAKGEIAVTLEGAGHSSQTRHLKIWRSRGIGWEFPNADRMGQWHYSMMNEEDEDPTGADHPPGFQSFQMLRGGDMRPLGARVRRDPAYPMWMYRNYLDWLEVLANDDMTGKWAVRPRALKERRILWKEVRDAEEAARRRELYAGQVAQEQAARQLKLAEQDALSFMESATSNARRYEDGQSNGRNRTDSMASAALEASKQTRRISNGSLISISAKKGPRTSITSIASNQTSTTQARSGPSASKHRLSRAIFHRRQ